MVRFINGLSCLINTDTTTSSKKRTHSTGLLSGRIEAWKMPTLALQLMICCEDLLPDSKGWLFAYGIKKEIFRFPVKDCILSSLASLLDFIYMNSSKKMSEDEIDSNMFYTINVVRFHHLKLRMLHRILNEVHHRPSIGWRFDCASGTKPISWRSVYVGEKSHVSYHFRYFKKEIGADKSLSDQEIPENKNKSLVKKNWLGCSKRPSVYIDEMTRMIIRDTANLFVRFCRDQSVESVPSREAECRAKLSSLDPLISDTPLSMRSSRLVFNVLGRTLDAVDPTRELYIHPKLSLKKISQVLQGNL